MANKKIMPPTKERKADTTKNVNDLSEYIEHQKKRVIYVTKEKQTSEYADWYRRERLKIK